MAEEGIEEHRPTFKEVYRRYKLLFLAVMFVPVIGMVAVIGILYMHPSSNLPLQVALVFFLLVQYVISIYVIARRMEAIISS